MATDEGMGDEVYNDCMMVKTVHMCSFCPTIIKLKIGYFRIRLQLKENLNIFETWL